MSIIEGYPYLKIYRLTKVYPFIKKFRKKLAWVMPQFIWSGRVGRSVGQSVGRSVERTRWVVTTRRTGMMGGDERRDARARDTRVTSAWRAA